MANFFQLNIKGFYNLSDSEREYIYNDGLLFLRMLQNSVNQGLLDKSQLEELLISAGFTQNGNNWYRDSRPAFSTWIHEKFGPFIKKIGEYGLLYGVGKTLIGDKQTSTTSPVTTDSTDSLGSSESNSSGIWKSIKDWFNSSGIGDALVGFGSQLGNSVLNMRNMEQLIDKQNEYNTPAAQMQRFADAGLNPNLIYGLGNNGNQPASGSVAPVDFDTSQRENRMAKMQIETQSAIAKADVAQKMSASKLADMQASGQELENQLNEATLQNRISQVATNLAISSQDLEKRKFEVKTQDEAYRYMIDLQTSQIYANYLSGHSIFGKVVNESLEWINKGLDYIKTHFPYVYDKFTNSNERAILGEGMRLVPPFSGR